MAQSSAMLLASGRRLGPYEIIAPLGAGGMGEVYRARDTRLARDVAIKVLPRRSAADLQLRERLEREARVLSSLDHPHICVLHDLGTDHDLDYLVMQLLDGETLADRLTRGALPVAEVLALGAQIADALAAAHRRGIVHRDLKPANIMLTPAGVKLLDFGIARTLPAFFGSAADFTTEAGLTAAGSMVGTVQYMAPEVLEGRPADARSDIFALGAVLFEMATGARAFSGTSPVAIASAIMTTDPPPVSSVQPGVPLAFDRLVALCVARDPDRRWQSAHDVKMLLQAGEIDAASATGPRPTGAARGGSWLAWGVAAAAIAVALAVTHWGGAPRGGLPRVQAVTFSVDPPAGGRFFLFVENTAMALSPDGSQLAFVASDPKGIFQVWVRPLAADEAAPVSGTEGARGVFWSSDGKTLGFFAGDQLKRIDLGGAAPVALCPTHSSVGYAGSWGADGQILFASSSSDTGIMRVSSAGGTPVQERAADPPRGEMGLRFPSFLPDGRHYLYWSKHRDGADQLMIAAQGDPPRTVMPVSSNASYVDPGYLVYAREGTLLARRFDALRGEVSGDPVAIATPVNYFVTTGVAHFSASPSGVLAYQAHRDQSTLAWFDRAGARLSTAAAAGGYLNLGMSPDTREVLFARADPTIGTFDLWKLDLTRGVENRVISKPGNELSAVWIPRRQAFVFAGGFNEAPRLMLHDEKTGTERPLLGTSAFQEPTDVTADGEWLAYTERRSNRTTGLFVTRLSAAGREAPSTAFDSPFDHEAARFSPDGHALAFLAADSGSFELYLAPFPDGAPKRRVSTNGALAVRWSRDGRELYYLSRDGQMMAVAMNAGRQTGPPVPRFALPRGGVWRDFQVAADGRFLAIVPESLAGEQPITVIVNWLARPH